MHNVADGLCAPPFGHPFILLSQEYGLFGFFDQIFDHAAHHKVNQPFFGMGTCDNQICPIDIFGFNGLNNVLTSPDRFHVVNGVGVQIGFGARKIEIRNFLVLIRHQQSDFIIRSTRQLRKALERMCSG